MTHARIPDFSQPVPVRSTAAQHARRRLPRGSPLPQPARRDPARRIEPWQAVTPVRPDTAHSRSLRFLDVAGELLAAVAIIGGGMVLTGLASLL